MNNDADYPCCEICGQDFESEKLVRLHMKEEHEKFGAQCPFCDLKQVDIDELRFHVNTAHSDILSPLRSNSTDQSNVPEEHGKRDWEGVKLVEVAPQKFDRDLVQTTTELSPSQEFCSPEKNGEMDTAFVDDSIESIKMEVFYKSSNSLDSSSSDAEPNREDVSTPSKATSSKSESRNKRLISEVEGLWQELPSTSGRSEFMPRNGRPWFIESSDSEEEEDLMAGGLGRVTAKPKETLLNLSKRAKHIDEPILCPFCGLGDYDTEFIRHHVDLEHADASSMAVTPKSDYLVLPKMEESDQSGESGEPSTAKRKLFTNGDSTAGEEKGSCPICPVEGLLADKLERHVNSHFESSPVTNDISDRLVAEQLQMQEKEQQDKREKESLKLLQQQYGMDEKGSYKRQAESKLEKALFHGDMGIAEFYNQKSKLQRVQSTGEEDSRHKTSGVIASLSRFYNSNVYNVDHARLAEQTDHFGSSPGCRGWGCGYRNLQMLLSAMWHVPRYREVVFNGKNAIPSINYIQKLIENAWQNGFDPAGREQLGNRLVNTRKWIGATEIIALLHSLRVKCKLVDFHKSSGQGGTHPRMFEWVRDYFGRPSLFGVFGKEEAALSKKMPLYLQHQGHSRTIVGYEVLKDGAIRLLLFDPSAKPNDMATLRAGNVTGAALKPLRKTLGQLKHKQYQLVAVTGLITSDREYEESKLLTSVRIP
ncbi:putative zinc finger with UFM1-specific peptidase domain protein [Apostichopus japonicus]|uniref:Putative zinc finger with UFM1-specific peptidase domain protein n=1 Tax=Stichopus japonicus TaxID=307972 RepID=A0A2G8JW58_STIJA|nr:putative zinc finger with UFM1-specific peptidase domain protein [Apostichopus japonicus]